MSIDRAEQFRKKRNEALLKGMEEAIAIFNIEANFRDLVLRKIIKKYYPKDTEIKAVIKREVLATARDVEALKETLRPMVKEIVEQQITDLGEEYIRKIKAEFIDDMVGRINDY